MAGFHIADEDFPLFAHNLHNVADTVDSLSVSRGLEGSTGAMPGSVVTMVRRETASSVDKRSHIIATSLLTIAETATMAAESLFSTDNRISASVKSVDGALVNRIAGILGGRQSHAVME